VKYPTGRWTSKGFGASGGKLGIFPCDAKASAGPLAPLLNIPREFMPTPLDRFQITDRDLDPTDHEALEQVEIEIAEHKAQQERDGV
jgi:hypothetical protein